MKFTTNEKRFWKTKFSYKGLKNIPEEVEQLTFRDEYLTNKELGFITSRIKRIERLDLDSTSIDDDGIFNLSAMKYIGELRLVNLEITDNAIDNLLKLQSLKLLHLGSTKVSCDGVLRLSELRNLKELFASPTKVEKEKLDEFLRRKPDCELTINSKPYSKINYNF